MVGTSYNALGNFLGFVWKAGTMTALGTLGGDWSEAYAINNKGQITGIAYTKRNIQAHAYLLTGKTMIYPSQLMRPFDHLQTTVLLIGGRQSNHDAA